MTSAAASNTFDASHDKPQPCSIAVLFDDAPSRARAIHLCDHLVHQFWQDMHFRMNWWKTAHLENADISQAAAWSVRHAQIVIVAAVNRTDLPESVKTWLESALAKPTGDGRILIGFGAAGTAPSGEAHPLLRELQNCATRAGVDFLPRLLPDNGVLAAQHAHRDDAFRMTSVLRAILEQPQPPPLMQA